MVLRTRMVSHKEALPEDDVLSVIYVHRDLNIHSIVMYAI